MTIALLVRNYKPYNSAVGICMSNILEILGHDHKIIVLCEKNSIYESSDETIDGERILRFLSSQTKARLTLENLIDNSSKYLIPLLKIANYCLRVFFYVLFILQKTSIRHDLVESYVEALNSIDERIDLIIPTCMPIESIVAAYYYCDNHDSVYIPVLFDKFASNKTLQRFKLNQLLKYRNNVSLETELLQSIKCKRFLYTKSWERHIHQYHNTVASEKGFVIEHPLLLQVNDVEQYTFPGENDIKIVFAGTLTYKGRNPKYALKMIKDIIEDGYDIGVYIFGCGDAMEIVRNYSQQYPNHFYYLGQVQTRIAHAAMAAADCLLSFGNEDITQTASKVFEYMSYCKPIIHLARYDNDPVNELLLSYPAAYVTCTNKEVREEELIELKNFIQQCKDLKVNFYDLENEFKEASPKYSAQLITE